MALTYLKVSGNEGVQLSREVAADNDYSKTRRELDNSSLKTFADISPSCEPTCGNGILLQMTGFIQMTQYVSDENIGNLSRHCEGSEIRPR